MNTAPKRRWSFSLRTLLVLVLLVGTVAGLGIREAMQRNEEELDRQHAKQAIKDAWQRNDRGQPVRKR